MLCPGALTFLASVRQVGNDGRGLFAMPGKTLGGNYVDCAKMDWSLFDLDGAGPGGLAGMGFTDYHRPILGAQRPKRWKLSMQRLPHGNYLCTIAQ